MVKNRGLLTFAVALGAVMQVLDTSMISVALPHLMGSLSATQDQVSWVLTFYVIAVAITTPASGFLALRIGQKRFFLICVVGFTVTSVFCGLSESLGEIVAFRTLQGVFAAPLGPMSQAILLNNYSAEERGTAMGWWTIGMMFGPIFGPTLGGAITEYFSWSWVFFVNVPIAIATITMVILFVPESKERARRQFDIFGFVVLGIALASLQFMLDRGERADWFSSLEIMILAGLSAAAFYVFAVHSLTARNPFINPAIFKSRNFSLGLVLMFLLGVIMLAVLALLPPYLQNLSGYPVLAIGLVLAPRGVGTLIASYIAGRLLKYIEPRPIIALGMALGALSTWQFAQITPDVSASQIIFISTIQGIGMGFFFVPLSIVTFSDLKAAQLPTGTALFALSRNLGSSIGVAVVVGALIRNTQRNYADLTPIVSPFNEIYRHVPLPSMWDIETRSGLAAIGHEIGQQASASAYITDFLLLTIASVVCIPLVFLCRNPRAKKTVETR
ncbi:MAG: DHA2 family efflux MFS transporter permease subunit [Alphaproteobacteria bacterium]|nr:DHA2 family efflux MFS transporter permease subunit [Alphaproteobacteria bacterium]